MPDVYLEEKRLRLDPAAAIGKGGEADIYDIGGGRVLKLFKQPDHPDLVGDPAAQKAARERIATHQKKLLEFPKGLPPNVIAPEALVKDRSGQIVGYAMRFLKGGDELIKFGQRSFRQGVSHEDMLAIFRHLHGTVEKTHAAKVDVGDFNDLNVLVLGKVPSLIDADSMQFGKYYCTVFTTRFVDPTLCDPNGAEPLLIKPHNANSDWYAYAVMLMQCFLFVDPYGGIYKPKDHKKQLPHPTRPLRRITVFDPEVRYPKPAVPYGVLPDDLLHHFQAVFIKDQRGVFPLKLLDQMRATKCTTCSTEHFRAKCPNCATASPAAVKEVTVIRGSVTATRLFQTHGAILRADVQGGQLIWLYHENNEFRREDRAKVADGKLDPQMRYRLQRGATYLAKQGRVIKLVPNQAPDVTQADSFGNTPVFDVNERHVYWTRNSQLHRDGQLGPEYVGDVLSGQTMIWSGPNFGFGFYRAGQISVAFVFGATTRGINDSVQLPPLKGQLIDATCVFTKDRCWFFTSSQENGHTVNRCTVIKSDGSIEATAEAQEGDGSWLSHIRGGAAAGSFLLMPTDDGIVRVEPDQGKIVETKRFPDTEPFVEADSRLLFAADGIYVVGRTQITKLVIK